MNSAARPSESHLCVSCLYQIGFQRSQYATVATAAAESQVSTQQDTSPPPVTHAGPQKAYRLLASPVLSRPPLLTRELTPFEKAYYLYQKRLNERLALPFQRYFYYKKGTPSYLEWKRKAKNRKSAARDIGLYSGYGTEAWNDEILVGDETSEPANQVQALIRDAEGVDPVTDELVGDDETGGEAISGDARVGEGTQKPIGQDVVVDRPLPRITEADQQNDVKSLSRRLDRSLYLLVQNRAGQWRFPEDRVYGRENLHQVIECRSFCAHFRGKVLTSTRLLSVFSSKLSVST
jgi:large subunit ribosomal protein L46